MKILKKASDYWNSHKNKPLFKGKALAVVVIILAIIVNFAVGTDDTANKNTSKSSGGTSVSEEEKAPKRELHIGTSNVIALGICIAALGAVKIKREKDLNGRHDKVEKNHKEE